MGGAGSAGANRNLNIVIFAKGSVFDRAIAGSLPGGVADGNGPTVLLNTSGWAGNLSQAQKRAVVGFDGMGRLR